jgi:FKBP-type peptidyl-prolyl cis-trans isomerase
MCNLEIENGSQMNRMRTESWVSGFLAAMIAISICSCGARRSGPSAIDPDAPKEFTTLPSGLQYRILRKSDGQKPLPSDQVEVDYSGWLDDGTVFDSSYDRAQPLVLGLGKMIPGWVEGLQLIGEGGMIELQIPSELGYGPAGQPPKIPPAARLHFKIELKAIKDTP